MPDATVAVSDTFLLWLLVLLIVTALLFGWRCQRAGVLALFGHCAMTASALSRLAIAAVLPALLCGGWFVLNPELSHWAWLGTAHLAVGWYGLRWLLPDGLATRSTATAT